MKSIDIKSLLIGILGTALVMVLMGQSSMNNRYDVECVFITPEKRADGTEYPKGHIACRKFNLIKDKNLLENKYRMFRIHEFVGF